MRKTTIPLVVGALLLVALGFAVSRSGFAGNLIAEAIGILISVAIALTLVEDLVRRRRREEWSRVRRQTLRSLCGYIEDIAFRYAMALPDSPLDIRTNAHWASFPDSDAVEAACQGFLELEQQMKTNAPRLASQPDLDASSSKNLFAEFKDDFAPIRDVLTPRIMSLDDDPELSLLLMELEEASRRWNLVLPAIEEWGVRDEEGWQEAIKVLSCARAVYESAARELLQIPR
jgi:hypothetical protein